MTKTTAHGLMLLTAFIWGTTFIAQTTGMETIGPMTFTSVRYLIGAITVLPLALFEARRISLWAHLKSDKWLALQTAGLGCLMFGGIGFQQTALQYTDVANAAFLTALYVPAVPLILWLFMRSTITIKIWLALLMSLAGSWFLSGNAEILQQWGDFLVAIGAIFWAGHIILIGIVMRKLNAPFQIAVFQSLICVVLGAIPMLAIEQPAFSDLMPVAPELFYAGCFSVGLAYTLQLIAQAHASTVLAAFILSLESVFAALAGWLVLGQSLSHAGLLGCTLIFAAVLMADVIPEQWYKKPR